jgi:replicative DNA helicase
MGSDHKSYSKNDEVAAISKALKNMAKELGCVVIALSQLSRAVEQRADKRPLLSDLRDSGAIEQDADTVMMIYRPEYYGIREEDGKNRVGVAEIVVGKQRNGGVGTEDLRFEKAKAKFVDPWFDDEGVNNGNHNG